MAKSMLTWDDESGYLVLGELAATGQLSLFQDEMLGTRMPLPFYVLGASQIVWGKSLLAARLLSLALGVAALVAVAVLARCLGGDLAGLLAALFFATQAVFVGYLATATYHALGAAILMTGLALIMCGRPPWSAVAGSFVVSLLFLVRTNLWPLPAVIVPALLVSTRSRLARASIVVSALIVPIAFFASDSRHLKLLAYVPLLGALVEPLGYRSHLSFIGFEPVKGRAWAFVRWAVTYEFWTFAVVLLAAIVVTRTIRAREVGPFFASRPVLWLAALLAYMAATQIVLFWDRLRYLTAYFPSWAPILPVVLGVEFAAALRLADASPGHRRALAALLVALLAAPVVIVRHPLLPPRAEVRETPLRDLGAAATRFERLIPSDAKIFLWGNPLPLYLGGRIPYLQQIYSNETLAAVEDRAVIEKNGLWGLAEIDRWLSADADFAVIDPSLFEHLRGSRSRQIARMQELLATRFELVDRVAEYRWTVFDVYARRSVGAPRSADLLRRDDVAAQGRQADDHVLASQLMDQAPQAPPAGQAEDTGKARVLPLHRDRPHRESDVAEQTHDVATVEVVERVVGHLELAQEKTRRVVEVPEIEEDEPALAQPSPGPGEGVPGVEEIRVGPPDRHAIEGPAWSLRHFEVGDVDLDVVSPTTQLGHRRGQIDAPGPHARIIRDFHEHAAGAGDVEDFRRAGQEPAHDAHSPLRLPESESALGRVVRVPQAWGAAVGLTGLPVERGVVDGAERLPGELWILIDEAAIETADPSETSAEEDAVERGAVSGARAHVASVNRDELQLLWEIRPIHGASSRRDSREPVKAKTPEPAVARTR